MFGNKPASLVIPPLAKADPQAIEIARVWLAAGNPHVSLRPDAWEDPAAWGLLLVDLAKHLALGYHQATGRDPDHTLKRIREGFDAEWSHATDAPTGGLQ
jgi:hypothetical protein